MTKHPILLLLGVTFLIFSCKKSKVETPGPEPDPILKKRVELFDESTQRINNSGIKVSIENSTPLVTTVTNEQGEFSLPLKNLPELFTVVFEKEGIGTYKNYFKRDENGDLYELRYGRDYLSVDHEQPYQLGSKSSVKVNSIIAETAGNKLRLRLDISSAGGQNQKYVRLLLQKDLPGLSINTVSKTVKNVAHVLPVNEGENLFEFYLGGFMYCYQYVPGDRIYVTAYGDAFYSNWYAEQPSGDWKYPNLKFVENNPVASFVIP